MEIHYMTDKKEVIAYDELIKEENQIRDFDERAELVDVLKENNTNKDEKEVIQQVY